ncbi:MAG: hypothetical protein K2X03_27190 [Bryobacteraceae bacterium]|nr:hypothetical protein [Bryobacteraceae bacterium]
MKLLALTTLFSLLAYAAELAGKWEIRAESNDGNKHKVTLVLREDWGSWSGVILTDEEEIRLKGLAVDGDKLTFEVPTEEGTYTVKVVVKGDKLEGTFTAGGVKGEVKGTRL